jgi:four helix bundle protein
MSVKSYRELEVWQLAMSLAEDVYGILKDLPNEERFALSNQLRRAVISVPSNIAEGFGRDSTKDFLHFIAMARGSLYEVMTQMELVVRLDYVPEQEGFLEKAERVGMMLNALSVRLRRRLTSPTSEPRTKNP